MGSGIRQPIAGTGGKATNPRALAAAVARVVRDRRLLTGCRRLLVGVSGGADSVALLHVLHTMARGNEPDLVVAHLHHGIRGAAADRDETFVQALACRLGVGIVTAHADVPARARRDRVSLEMAARSARHEFFRDAAAQVGADRVALAHTADDQAETVLLRLCRGAGASGLAGMRTDVSVDGIRIIRPLLGIPRSAIEAYLREQGVRWRTDASNRDSRHLRNRVRHRILPLLARELNPSVSQALWTAAEVCGAEDDLLESLAGRAFVRMSGDGTLDAERLRRQPVALQRRLLRRWLRERAGSAAADSFAAVERVRRLAAAARDSGRVPVGRGRTVERCGCRLAISPSSSGAIRSWRATALNMPGTTHVAGAGLVFEARFVRGYGRRVEPGPGTVRTVAWFDATRVGDAPWTVRPWRSGDRYRPMGAPGTTKIHDILVNAKVPRSDRAGLPVVEVDGEIAWVPGHRIAEGWQVRGRRSRSIRVEMTRSSASG